MRDISNKPTTLRTARAESRLRAGAAVLERIRRGDLPKGDPLPVAKVAAVQAAKNTSLLIPYCHPLPVDFVGVEFEFEEGQLRIQTTVKAVYKTGVEMEALTAAAVAALTIYDMAKVLDEDMEIGGVHLLSKKGGKSDFRERFAEPPRAAVLVLSDSIAAGKKEDISGRMIEQRLKDCDVEVAEYRVISDDPAQIEAALLRCADEQRLDLVLTTGGTGFSPRDNTPEVMRRVIEREAPGIAEAARQFGQARTPFAMLSRGAAGVRGRTLIVNLPGSRGGVADALDALLPGLLHSLKILHAHPHADDPRPEVVA